MIISSTIGKPATATSHWPVYCLIRKHIAIKELNPDVMITEFSLRQGDGIERGPHHRSEGRNESFMPRA
jgi:hypothetical protein